MFSSRFGGLCSWLEPPRRGGQEGRPAGRAQPESTDRPLEAIGKGLRGRPGSQPPSRRCLGLRVPAAGHLWRPGSRLESVRPFSEPALRCTCHQKHSNTGLADQQQQQHEPSLRPGGAWPACRRSVDARQHEADLLLSLDPFLPAGTKKAAKVYTVACHPLQPHIVAVGANAGTCLVLDKSPRRAVFRVCWTVALTAHSHI